MNFRIRTVDSAADLTQFIKSQWNFYKGDPNFVPPVLMDRRKLLNETKNPFFKHARVRHFLAKDGSTVIGRISAIVNDNHNTTYSDKVGFFGFFECVNSVDVARALVDEAAAWLRVQGMTHIRGPVNPSMNDEAGLLVDGFDTPPVFLMTYNPPYYASLLEQCGFRKEMDMFAYLLENATYESEKMKRLVSIVRQRSGVTFRSVNLKDKVQFAKDVETIRAIFNKAWEKNWGAVRFTDEEFDYAANDLKQVADPDFIFFAEIKGQAVGLCLAMPDMYQVFKHNKNGGLVGALWHLLTKRKRIDMIRIIILGVLEEYRHTGIDAALYAEIAERAKAKGILRGEASWILENNEAMNRALTQTMHAKVYKTYRVYQKTINPNSLQ